LIALTNHVHGSSTSTQLVHENIIFMVLTNHIHRGSTFTHTRVSLNPVDYSSSVFSLAKLQVNCAQKKISPTVFIIDRLQHSNVFFHTHSSMFNLTNKIIQHTTTSAGYVSITVHVNIKSYRGHQSPRTWGSAGFGFDCWHQLITLYNVLGRFNLGWVV